MTRTYGGIAHTWAAQTKDSGKNGNIFFNGPRIYSYGHHFCMANFVEPKVVLVSTREYSVSTSSHQRAVRDALNGLGVQIIYVHDADGQWPDNVRRAKEDFDAKLVLAGRARTNQQRYLDAAERIRECNNEYVAWLHAHNSDFEVEKYSIPEIDPDLVERLTRQANLARREETARHKAFRAAHEERCKKELEEYMQLAAAGEEAWRNGGRWPTLSWDAQEYARHHKIMLPMFDNRTRLRLIEGGKIIETSRGARVPTRVARFLWEMIQTALVDGGWSYDPTVPVHVGDFELREIRDNGDVQIGCHTICYDELELMAKRLGIYDRVPA